MTQPLTLAVIGDSAAAGVGDSDANGNHFGWGYHLAQAFNEPLIYINAARHWVAISMSESNVHPI